MKSLRSNLRRVNLNISQLEKGEVCHVMPRSVSPFEEVRSPRNEVSKLQKQNQELVSQLRESQDEVFLLKKRVAQLEKQLRISKAKNKAQEIDSEKENYWDETFTGFYKDRIGRYLKRS